MSQRIDQCRNNPMDLVTEVLCVGGAGGVKVKQEYSSFIPPDLGEEKS